MYVRNVYEQWLASIWNTSERMEQTHFIQSAEVFKASITQVTREPELVASLQTETSSMISVSHALQSKAKVPATMARNARAKRSLAILCRCLRLLSIVNLRKLYSPC